MQRGSGMSKRGTMGYRVVGNVSEEFQSGFTASRIVRRFNPTINRNQSTLGRRRAKGKALLSLSFSFLPLPYPLSLSRRLYNSLSCVSQIAFYRRIYPYLFLSFSGRAGKSIERFQLSTLSWMKFPSTRLHATVDTTRRDCNAYCYERDYHNIIGAPRGFNCGA